MGQWDSGTVYGCPLLLPAGPYSRKQEGSGAFGARVLSVVRCPPTDGFRPGTDPPSGLVQRVVIKSTPWRQGGRLRRHFIMRPQGATITL